MSYKSSVKRFELPLQRFSKTALPLYLELIAKHQLNIQKFKDKRDWEQARKETLNAHRTISQLQAAICEVDDVRNLLTPEEEIEFDSKIKPYKTRALETIHNFKVNYCSSSGFEEIVQDKELENVRLQLHYQDELLPEEIEVEQRRAQLETYENLQQDIQELHELFSEFSQNVHAQGEQVDNIEENVETAFENVTQGERFLIQAAKYKTALYPFTGALIGTCIGGPVGLLAGIKIGSIAAFGGSVLGFTSGQVVKKWQENNTDQQLSSLPRSQTMSKEPSSLKLLPTTLKKSHSFTE